MKSRGIEVLLCPSILQFLCRAAYRGRRTAEIAGAKNGRWSVGANRPASFRRGIEHHDARCQSALLKMGHQQRDVARLHERPLVKLKLLADLEDGSVVRALDLDKAAQV